MDVIAQCPYCGEPLDLYIDEAGGTTQRYIEDCSVCCKPIEVDVVLAPGDSERDDVRVSLRAADG